MPKGKHVLQAAGVLNIITGLLILAFLQEMYINLLLAIALILVGVYVCSKAK